MKTFLGNLLTFTSLGFIIYFCWIVIKFIKNYVQSINEPNSTEKKLDKLYERKQFLHKILLSCCGFILCAIIGGSLLPNDTHSTSKKNRTTKTTKAHKRSNKKSQSNNSIKSNSSSFSKSANEDSSEMHDVSHTRGKNISNNLNSQISQHPELTGFSVNYNENTEAYEVTVPSEVTASTDNEQKTLYNTIVGAITKSDPDARIEFYNPQHMEVAHTGIFTGNIKLDE